MKLMKLTVTKVTDKKGFINSLRDLYCTLSLADRVRIATDLPFTDDEMWTEASHVEKVIGPFCEYTYEQVPFPGNDNVCTPPWESPEYIAAKNWYDTLSPEDQGKIDILVQANMPWG